MKYDLNKLHIPTTEELYELYGDDLLKQMMEHRKHFPKKNGDLQEVRIKGKRNIERFINTFHNMSAFEKIRFTLMKYHAVPAFEEHPCMKWSWVLDVCYWQRKD